MGRDGCPRRAGGRGPRGAAHRPPLHRRPRRQARPGLRRLHRLRCPRRPPHRPGPARSAPAQHRPLARRGNGPASGARGGARADDVPAAEDPRLRPHRGTRRGGPGHGRPAQRRHHTAGARVRLARLLRRPRPALPLRPHADGRGRGRRPRRRAAPGRRAARRARPRPRRAAREGGAGTPQRHGRNARHAADGVRRPRAAVQLRRCRGGAVAGGAAGDRPGARPRAARRPAAPGAGRQRGQHAQGAGGVRPHRPPPGRRTAGAGRLLGALCAAGRRSGPGHARARPRGRRAGAGLVRGQPGGAARRAGRVQRELPRSPGRLRPRLPRRRRRGPRLDRRAPQPTGCWTRTAPTGCRRSWPTTRVWTPG